MPFALQSSVPRNGIYPTTIKMNSKKIIRIDDFVKRPRSRRANLVPRGVLSVRRSGSEMTRNAEIGLFTKSSNQAESDAERRGFLLFRL
jgi:hypothetical protein